MLVSVIIPTYNCEAYIFDALRSALAQGTAVDEIIVVDDGSVDQTPAIVEEFGAPVRLIRQSNRGPAAARNRGLREARAEYVAFLDGDDLWLPGKLDAQLAFMASAPDAKFVYGRISYWNPGPDGRHGAGPPEEATIVSSNLDDEMSGWIYPELLLDSVVCTISVLMHRSVFETIGGFDEHLRTGEDYDYWLRASRCFAMYKLARYVARYRLHASGTTRAVREEPNELKVLLRAVDTYGRFGPDGRSVGDRALSARIAKLWFDHGYMHYWHGDPKVSAAAFGNALRYRRDAKAFGYGLLATARAMFSGGRRRQRGEGAWL